MIDEYMLSIADIKKIIADEMAEIQAIEPEDNENLITSNVRKLHYRTECKAIMNRIMKFILEREEQDHD